MSDGDRTDRGWDPHVGVRIGEALHPGPGISNESFLAAVSEIGLGQMIEDINDDFASVHSDVLGGLRTPDAFDVEIGVVDGNLFCNAAANIIPLVLTGGMHAAEDILRLARRISMMTSNDFAEAAIRNHTWSAINVPFIFGGAGDSESHPIIEWFVEIAREYRFSFSPDTRGVDTIRSIFSSFREGLRRLGISSREQLLNWFVQEGYLTRSHSIRPGAYLRVDL